MRLRYLAGTPQGGLTLLLNVTTRSPVLATLGYPPMSRMEPPMRHKSFPWGGESMIEALVSGKLHGQPAQKISKTGKPFVVAKVRAHAGDSDVFVNVIAFSQAACEALLALDDGDAVALAGSLTPKAWTDREGVARPALDLVASQVLSAYHVTRKRKAHDQTEPQPTSRHDELDDGRPLDF